MFSCKNAHVILFVMKSIFMLDAAQFNVSHISKISNLYIRIDQTTGQANLNIQQWTMTDAKIEV